MDLHIDDRGKYFTQRISKESVDAMVRTTDHFIVGNVYVRPDQRLKDELNSDHGRFVAITNARVYDALGERLLFATNFLLVTYEHVILISPVDAVTEAPHAAWVQQAPQE